MRIGLYISGAGHVLLILWLLFGSLIGWRDDEVKLRVSDVSFISEDEFAAMTAPRPEAAVAETPPAPAPEPEPTPEPEPEPEPEPAPAPEPAPQPRPEPTPGPTPEPEPEPTPEPAPEPEPIPDPVPEPPAPEPALQDAPRVAPTPAPKPAPEAEVAPERVDAPSPREDADATPTPEVVPTAPQEATTEIVTEAKTAAPTSSARPRVRPQNLDKPTPPKPPQPEPPAPASSAANAVASAVSDAIAGGERDVPQQDAPEGPPLTRGEKEGLRVAVQQCWDVGTISSDALRTTVMILVDMDRSGKPIAQSLRMVGWEGPSQAAADIAFQAARRAVLICGRNGYDLPAEKYGQWRQIELTFDPNKMRLR
ncbi:hypothetical protein XMM379_001450 [Aliiroseovarius sp. xm-m-379]|uniref:cell envelope biogenesis protein TolA n=1 Tax=unclassified Aliiroseovarius TaxID=2623558 RepID=UPI0015696AA3|nr:MULTISPECIES: cell envelope biogenesis protein TolA [unclassified Aliiroseovarius]NRP12387.1 hypothetical protein [Aliiroseovarius sp. xm-d-517]NRP24761.1 hypothetical protein [Aliiroseovarius sp. xm-m-379]NRP30604.1 hypothetical protein [Aliiroseovarius sp. xm-m-314]NRP33560.1 hypothetical protein [Aliiroseovarius sp. xm-a-104]NRP40667.1 hypothetical protein [Aliiroseovarius sp. xm-m-339-2]